jgi:hypothetical protein
MKLHFFAYRENVWYWVIGLRIACVKSLYYVAGYTLRGLLYEVEIKIPLTIIYRSPRSSKSNYTWTLLIAALHNSTWNLLQISWHVPTLTRISFSIPFAETLTYSDIEIYYFLTTHGKMAVFEADIFYINLHLSLNIFCFV